MSLVRIYALTAGALSRFFFSRPRPSPRRRPSSPHAVPEQRATSKNAGFVHELCLLLTPFRINTCKSVSKQSTLTTFRMNTYKKRGEGGVRLVRTGHIPDRLDREHPRHCER